jgi:cobalt-zinc-cadmium efflux system membrane fusion protein
MEATVRRARARKTATVLFALAAGCACRRAEPPAPGQSEPGHEAHHEAEELPGRLVLTTAAVAEAGIITWQVKPVDLDHLLVLTGSVGHDEDRLLQVAANVRGRVVSIPVDLGARVRRGDALAVVESVELGRAREELLRETASLRVAERAYERARALVDSKAISPGEFQAREGEYLTRRAAAQAAERALHLLGEDDEEIERLGAAARSNGALPSGDAPRLTLRAPFDGRVVDRKVTPGSLVEALQPLVTVADLRRVWVFLDAYEKDLALLREGLSVAIRTDAYPHESFGGRVDFLGATLDPATRTVKLRATVANRDERLKPGMFVRGQVDVPQPASEAKPSTQVVPTEALQTLEGRTTVFVLAAPGVFERRTVEVGHSLAGFTEVLSGIKVGDVVVAEGSFVLKSEFAKATLAEGH